MPPKGWKKYADGFKPATSQGTPVKDRQVYALDKLLMPRSVISRVAKEATDAQSLPKDGVTALQRSATVFINYLMFNANRDCQKQGRRIVTVQDVQNALETLGFGAFWGEIAKLLQENAVNEASQAANAVQGEGELQDQASQSQQETQDTQGDEMDVS